MLAFACVLREGGLTSHDLDLPERELAADLVVEADLLDGDVFVALAVDAREHQAVRSVPTSATRIDTKTQNQVELAKGTANTAKIPTDI